LVKEKPMAKKKGRMMKPRVSAAARPAMSQPVRLDMGNLDAMAILVLPVPIGLRGGATREGDAPGGGLGARPGGKPLGARAGQCGV
jgi:hypothetical protein